MEAPKHIIIFPFLAQGHIFPFLNLAKQLEQHTRKRDNNTVITLVSTPVNLAKIRNSISETCIKLAELPFLAISYGIQPGIESTESVPLNQYDPFFQAMETILRPSFKGLIASLINQGQSKICVICYYFLGWTMEVAEKYNISRAAFLTGGPYGLAVFFSLVVHSPPHSFFLGGSPTERTNLLDYPKIDVPYSDMANTLPGGTDDHPGTYFIRRQLLYLFRTHAVLLNSTEELDKQGIMLLRRYPSLPLYAIGPLVRERILCSELDSEEERCIKVLDSKGPNSVLYISFGSNNTIPASKMLELAKGLEASEKPFIWVIRPPSEFEDEVKIG